MNTLRRQAMTVLLGVFLSSGGPALAADPVVYSAAYVARANGLTATAHRSLEAVGDNLYQLLQTMEVRVLGARLGEAREESRFHWREERPVPQYYQYTQSGIARRRERVDFDWTTLVATSSEDDESWELPLTAGVTDSLSFQLLLRQRLADGLVDELTVMVVDQDEIESQLYRVVGEEVVETGLGNLHTVRVERIRAPGSSRATTFWLAKDWNFLLARFLQTNGQETETELVLEQAVIGAMPVTALP